MIIFIQAVKSPILYAKAIVSELAGDHFDQIVQSYGDAFATSSQNALPLFRLSVYVCNKGHFALAYALAKEAASIARPEDCLSADKWIYDYGLFFNLAHCAYQLKKYEEAKTNFLRALQCPSIPEEAKQEILNNLKLPGLT